MLRKYSQPFLSVLILSDYLAIMLSWLAAYWVRFEAQIIPVTLGIPPLSLYVAALIPIGIVFAVSIRLCGLLQPLRGKSFSSEIFTIVKVTSLSVLILTALTFFYREQSFSRVVVAYFGVFSTLGIVLAHWTVRKVMMEIRKRGGNVRNALIVGAGDLGQAVAEKIDLHPEMGLSIIGYLTHNPDKVGKVIGDHKALGLYNEAPEIIRAHNVEQLFVALPMKSHDRWEDILGYLGEETVDIRVVPDLLRYMNLQSGVEDLDGMPVININESPLYGWNVALKRVSDIVLSGLAIFLTAPLMLLIVILIKLESKDSVIFKQERVGLDNKVFSILKFRSMKVDAERQSGPTWARENDDRRTRVGAFLRKTSLDELPQLFNIFLGHMSLVGPRPERPVFVEDFKKSVPHYMLRLKMKAGLTGWAQVNGWRGNTSLQKRIEFDLYYIKNWSLMFDFKIIFMTLWKGFVNPHAY